MILCAFSYDCWKVSKELCSAFQDTGFAYLVNHGIEQHLVQQVDSGQLKHKLCGLAKEEEEQYHSTQAMEKSLEFFSLDEGVKEQMSKGPEYQVGNESLRWKWLWRGGWLENET